MTTELPRSSSSPPFIDGATIRRLTPMPALISALRKIFVDAAEGPLRHHHELPGNGTMLLMPAWRGDCSTGVKVVTVYRQATPSVQSTYLLLDGRDGRPKAIMDGAMLTSRRTAAASALAADMLARPDARCLLMMGAGTLAPHLVEAHCAVRPIDQVLIWGRNCAKTAATAAAISQSGAVTRAIADRLQALESAHIISTATLSNTPLVIGQRLKPGTHVDLVGAYKPDMCEADPACFARARVFVDTRAGVLAEAGDLLQAIAAGAMSASDIEADLAELCAGRHPGRGSDPDAVTVFKSVGTAIEDLAAAELVYEAWHRETHGA